MKIQSSRGPQVRRDTGAQVVVVPSKQKGVSWSLSVDVDVVLRGWVSVRVLPGAVGERRTRSAASSRKASKRRISSSLPSVVSCWRR